MRRGRLAAALTLWCWSVAVNPSDIMHVPDGDTVHVRLQIWDDVLRIERVRVLGVDTPEMHGQDRAAAEKAREFTRAWLAAEPSRLLYCGKRDKYGRALGTFSRQGSVLAQELIRAGLGKP